MFKTVAVTAEQSLFMDEIKALIKNQQERNNLTGTEMLAIASQLVGYLVALQDQNKHTSQQIMELVSTNVQAGNEYAIQDLFKNTDLSNPS